MCTLKWILLINGVGLAIRRQVAWQTGCIRSWEASGSCCVVVKHLAKLSPETLGRQTAYLPAGSSRAKVLGHVHSCWLPPPSALAKTSSGRNWFQGEMERMEGRLSIKDLTGLDWKAWERQFRTFWEIHTPTEISQLNQDSTLKPSSS